MLERFLEQQPAVCAALLSPEVRKGASEIFTLTESDISCAEDVVNARRPMKDATLLMSEESSPTACLIAPLHAKLIQDMKENTEETPVIREIKRVISDDLSRRYTTVQETSLLHKCASLDPRFKGLPFLSDEKREEAYKTDYWSFIIARGNSYLSSISVILNDKVLAYNIKAIATVQYHKAFFV